MPRYSIDLQEWFPISVVSANPLKDGDDMTNSVELTETEHEELQRLYVAFDNWHRKIKEKSRI